MDLSKIFVWFNIYAISFEENYSVPPYQTGNVDIYRLSGDTHQKNLLTVKEQEKISMGHIGYLLRTKNSNETIGWGWISLAHTPGPKHLKINKKRAWRENWIYDCRIEENFRSKGMYKILLRAILNDIFERSGNFYIMIDTRSTNLASIRGILKTGFKYMGREIDWRDTLKRIGVRKYVS